MIIPKRFEEIDLIKDIGVDRGGLYCLQRKMEYYYLFRESVDVVTANILKQEMLSFGGDVAIHRQGITHKVKRTNILLIGTREHLERLAKRLEEMRFMELPIIEKELKETLKNISINEWRYQLPSGKEWTLQDTPESIQLLNANSDSLKNEEIHENKIFLLELDSKEIKDKIHFIKEIKQKFPDNTLGLKVKNLSDISCPPALIDFWVTDQLPEDNNFSTPLGINSSHYSDNFMEFLKEQKEKMENSKTPPHLLAYTISLNSPPLDFIKNIDKLRVLGLPILVIIEDSDFLDTKKIALLNHILQNKVSLVALKQPHYAKELLEIKQLLNN